MNESTDSIESIQNLLQIYRRNLQQLEKQIALHGGEMSTPLHLLNQRDEVRTEIGRLEARLRELEMRVPPVGSSIVSPAQAQSAKPIDLPRLRNLIATHFNDSELRDLCFDLHVEFENLGGAGKGDKARELTAYMDRHERIAELVTTCSRLRPYVAW